MTFLAYIDVRPFLFLLGLPLFVGLSLLAGSFARVRDGTTPLLVFSALLFTALFTLFLTGIGPFIDQKEIREYQMTWEIQPPPSSGIKESEIVLSFVDFPGQFIGEFSDKVAAHLREKGEQEVTVVFELTLDYGKVRGFQKKEIGGLRDWNSERGYAGSNGFPSASPWD